MISSKSAKVLTFFLVFTLVESENIQNGSAPTFTNMNTMNRLVVKPPGNMIRMKCPAKGDPEPTIEWTKDGKPIERSMGQVSYGKWGISMEDLIPSDSGAYTCKVCNIHGCINFTSKVEIADRLIHVPVFKKDPKNQTVTLGRNVIFDFGIYSSLRFNTTWFHQKCQNDSECLEKTKIERDDEASDNLRIENVTYDDEGWYTCVVTNRLRTTAVRAYLKVVANPTFEDRIERLESLIAQLSNELKELKTDLQNH